MFTVSNFLRCCLVLGLEMMIQQPLLADNPINTHEIPNHMDYTVEKKEKKIVIGLAVETANESFLQDTTPIKEKFFQLAGNIPNQINQDIVVVYTDYEGDYTQSFTYIIGYEVKSLDMVPEGMRGVEIPPASYAVFTAKGEFPQSLINVWQTIWNSSLHRSYTTDFEVYPSDFNPQANPEVKVYIAVD